MPVAGKKEYRVYLTEESTEYVKSIIQSKKGEGGFSQLVDEVIIGLYATMKESGIKEGKKMTWTKVFRMLVNGITKP